jgi:hypothetical protein
MLSRRLAPRPPLALANDPAGPLLWDAGVISSAHQGSIEPSELCLSLSDSLAGSGLTGVPSKTPAHFRAGSGTPPKHQELHEPGARCACVQLVQYWIWK